MSCEWLANELKKCGKKRLKIIDSTWFLANSPFKNVSEDSARELFSKKRIPGAVFLDIDRIEIHPLRRLRYHIIFPEMHRF